MNNGRLIDDGMVMGLLSSFLIREKPPGYILDGVPRTVPQALMLPKVAPVDGVLVMHLGEEELLQKLTGRRVCAGCGRGYNVADIQTEKVVMPPMLPKVPNRCDDCEGVLEQREDDTLSVCEKRLKVYEDQTRPVVDYYRKTEKKSGPKIIDFELTGSIEVMMPKLRKVLRM